MPIESRTSLRSPIPVKHSDLPVDYLRMVTDVFAKNFDTALKKFAKIKADPTVSCYGSVYPSEVVVAISISHPDSLAANTFYASMDYDPRASSPKVEELLQLCIDAIAALCEPILNTKKPEELEALAEDSISALDNVPFEWTEVPFEKKRVFMKMDKSNPSLDLKTDDWLAKHDPETKSNIQMEQQEAKELFVTGASVGKKNVH